MFLRGSVASEQVAREIIEAARSVPGVSRVDSQLSVVPRRADTEEAPPPQLTIEAPKRRKVRARKPQAGAETDIDTAAEAESPEIEVAAHQAGGLL